jgi:hypothetical protein
LKWDDNERTCVALKKDLEDQIFVNRELKSQILDFTKKLQKNDGKDAGDYRWIDLDDSPFGVNRAT